MKKAILLCCVALSLWSCKQNEPKADQGSAGSTQKGEGSNTTDESKTPCVFGKVYDLCGFIAPNNFAVIGVNIPKPSEDNKYVIHRLINVSEKDSSRLLIHFKDVAGKELENPEKNVESFVLNLSKVVDAPSDTIKIDIKSKIEVVLYHENNESDEEILANSKSIFKDGRTLSKLSDEDYKKIFGHDLTKQKGKQTLLIPRRFGHGVIKP